MTRIATASSSPAARACWCSRNTSAPRRAAPRFTREIAGYGATSDGYDMVAPSGEGAVRCMRQALATVEDADRLHQSARHLDPRRRPQGNRSDSRSVRRRRKCPPISATKSLTGHSLGATGVQEAIYSLLMMQNGFICESANIEELDPDFADMPIVRKRRDNVNLRAVLSNSFGFGGTNATLVFKHPDA